MNTMDVNIDLSMYDLYIADAAKQVDSLTALLETKWDNNTNPDLIGNIKQIFQSISSGAKLCQLTIIAELSDNITSTLLTLLNDNHTAESNLQDLLLKAVELLSSLNNTSSDNAEAWFTDNLDDISELGTNILNYTFCSDNNSSTPATTSDHTSIADEIDASMIGLFRIEAEQQTLDIDKKLLELEHSPNDNDILEPLMRASHSIKGAARMISFNVIVDIAHRMEDCFVQAQNGQTLLDKKPIDLLLHCNDLLKTISLHPIDSLDQWISDNQTVIDDTLHSLDCLITGKDYELVATKPDTGENTGSTLKQSASSAPSDNTVRIHSDQLDKMLAVSNELLVSHQWMENHLDSLQKLKKRQTEMAACMDHLKQALHEHEVDDQIYALAVETESRMEYCRKTLNQEITSTDEFDRKSLILSSRLNQQVIASRMRSFGDGTHGFQRMVRDLSQSLGKKIKFEMHGLDTLVDSDILDKIEAPLTHLIRNAIDHGIESPEERINKGKDPAGTISLNAHHNAGRLIISITDDGKGVDIHKLQQKIVSRGFINSKMAQQLTDSETLDFLFLPGFSTRNEVTEYSGRGVGLDVVHTVIASLRGQIRSSSTIDAGMEISLQLPLTLSVLHSLLATIGGEYYAIPLARIHAVIKLSMDELFTINNKQIVHYGDQDISLINAATLLGYPERTLDTNNQIDIIILSERGGLYAIAIDKIHGETELALHTINSRLGKLRNISAAAIADDGLPTLILDIDDLVISIQEMISGNTLRSIQRENTTSNIKLKKVLVVDDSLTVREVERNLLEGRGYSVDIAVDGVDGWNNVRGSDYDLVITDIDMPRMNGIELVTHIKNDAKLKNIPVMIVSYKDNPEDRKNGLEAGADYYLTKGSFHDESLIDSVIDLIGEPD